ncbi:MAG: rdgB [Candidatus Midichloriaceae bacterium]|nr:rdgB [Candidatus Midichloriaceae bacterium]
MYEKFSDSKILIGSHNLYKVKQLGGYLAERVPGIIAISPAELGIASPPEVGETFEENCESKCIYYGKASVMVTISDDSGICVDALNGAPGIHTADWGFNGDFAPAIIRLKKELSAKPGDKFTAKMVSVVSIYWPEKNKIHTFRAEAPGYVNFDDMHSTGVGFQPIFYPHPYNKPASMLNDNEYRLVNARAKSFKKLLEACF